MAITLVQSTQKVTTGSTGSTLAFGSNTVAANLVAFSMATWGSPAGSINTPTGTNTYVPMVAEQQRADTLGRLRSYYAGNCAGGAETITYSRTNSGDITVSIAEFSAVAASPLDQTASAVPTGTASPSTGNTPTTTQADELLYGALTHDAITNITIAEGRTIIQEHEGGSADMPIGTEYSVVSATGTYAATWTLGSAVNSLCHIATFKAVAGAAAAARTRTRPFPFKPGSPRS